VTIRLGGNTKYLEGKAKDGDKDAKRDLDSLNIEVNFLIWDMFNVLNLTRGKTALQTENGFVFIPESIQISEINSTLDLFQVFDPIERLSSTKQLLMLDIEYRTIEATKK
jgi:hypothetical protein